MSILRKFLVTPRCIGCSAVGISLCPLCTSTINPVHMPQFASFALHVDEIMGAGPYDGWLRQSIIDYKNGQREKLEGLGQLLNALLAQRAPVLVVPIPSSYAKVQLRGFDTVADLAREATAGTSHSLGIDVLQFTREVTDQVGLSQRQRRLNLINSMRCNRLVPPVVCVIDDVITTGATMSAAAVALRRAGAQRVFALSLCVAAKSG